MNHLHCVQAAVERPSLKPVQRGQSSIEYVIVCSALAAALFVPIKDDVASPDKARTTVQIILEGFQTAYQKFSYAISLPT